MAGLDTTEPEEWREIGGRVKHVRKEVLELVDVLNTIPKSEWRKEHDQALDGMDALKDQLDSRFAEEHPDEFEPSMFYGEGDTEPDWE